MGSSSYEKSVKGATKPKNAAPKPKYIEHLLTATHDPSATAEVIRCLSLRLADPTWTICFKALLVIHLLIREATPGVALSYLSKHPESIRVSCITETSPHGFSIASYAAYLRARAHAYADTKVDYVRGDGQGRLRRLSVEKGLLRETEIVQKQIHALLKCNDFLVEEPENEITLTAYRLVTLDLLSLFSAMNEGTINVLEHYFTLSRADSIYALQLYRRFSAQTDAVVKFLRTARRYETQTCLQIPSLKHASTDLEKLLEDDLADPEFEARRKEYRRQKENERSGKATKLRPAQTSPSKENATSATDRTEQSSASAAPVISDAQKGIIDFFDSIDPTTTAQTQAAPQQQQQFQQQQAFPTQQTNNPFLQQQPPQPQPQPQQQAVFQQMPMQNAAAQPQFAFPTGWSQQQTPFTQFSQQQQQQQQQAQQPQQQQQQQSNNPFGTPQPQPLQAQSTGAGFGGYGPQPQQQTYNMVQSQQTGFNPSPFSQTQQQQPQLQLQTNPLGGASLTSPPATAHGYPYPSTPLSSIPQNGVYTPQQPLQTAPYQHPMATGPSSTIATAAPLQRHNTAAGNPFRQSAISPQKTGGSNNPFAKRVSTAPGPLMPQRTGTNPFAKPQPVQPQATGLVAQPTGSNPFRASMMAHANAMEQNTTIGGLPVQAVNATGGGGGYQLGQQGGMGNLI